MTRSIRQHSGGEGDSDAAPTRRTKWLRVGICFVLCGFLLMGGVVLGSRVGIPFIGTRVIWSIGVYEGASPLDLVPASGTQNPVLAPDDVTDVDAEFVADPFVLTSDSGSFMFFEVMNEATGHGDIALARSRDGLQWDYDRIVLDEPFHLSYPKIIQRGDDVFLIPETEKDLSVRLYQATDFPYQWAHVETLLEGRHFLDPTVFRHAGSWWMLVSFLGNDVLALYRADELEGPWREHPLSPVVRGDPNHARPGGSVIEWEGRLFRFGQDDSPSYGNQLFAVEILTLDSTHYAEAQVPDRPVLRGSGGGWNEDGMHHVDAHFVAGRWLAFVDGWTRRTVLEWPF